MRSELRGQAIELMREERAHAGGDAASPPSATATDEVPATSPASDATAVRTGAFCPTCGERIDSAWRFCSHCGGALEPGGADGAQG